MAQVKKEKLQIEENKPSKQKKDVEKRWKSKQQESFQREEEEKNEDGCKNFIMVNDDYTLNTTPLQNQYWTPPPAVPLDKIIQTNIIPIMDEYAQKILKMIDVP